MASDWLSDEDINGYLALLCQSFYMVNPSKCWCINSFVVPVFISKLYEPNDYTNVSGRNELAYRILGKLPVECSRLIIPINIENVHWIIAVVLPALQTICLYDSFYIKGSGLVSSTTTQVSTSIEIYNLCIFLRHYYQSIDNWNIRLCSYNKPQPDTSTCGVYVRLAAEINVAHAAATSTSLNSDYDILDDLDYMSGTIHNDRLFQDRQYSLNKLLPGSRFKYTHYDYHLSFIQVSVHVNGNTTTPTIEDQGCAYITLHPTVLDNNGIIINNIHTPHSNLTLFTKQLLEIQYHYTGDEEEAETVITPIVNYIVVSESLDFMKNVLPSLFIKSKGQLILISKNVSVELLRMYSRSIKHTGGTLLRLIPQLQQPLPLYNNMLTNIVTPLSIIKLYCNVDDYIASQPMQQQQPMNTTLYIIDETRSGTTDNSILVRDKLFHNTDISYILYSIVTDPVGRIHGYMDVRDSHYTLSEASLPSEPIEPNERATLWTVINDIHPPLASEAGEYVLHFIHQPPPPPLGE